MSKSTTETENPKVELANKDWVMKELMDTERRIEKAFHEQTQFLSAKNDNIQKAFQEQTQFLSTKNDNIQKAFQEQAQLLSAKNDDLKKEIMNMTRWMIGLTIAIILAVIFKGEL